MADETARYPTCLTADLVPGLPTNGTTTCVKDVSTYACPWAQGNSLNDARLPLKAVCLGQKMAAGFNAQRGALSFATVKGIDHTSTFGSATVHESPAKETAFASAADVSAWLEKNVGSQMQ